jgi:hypothetical protein
VGAAVDLLPVLVLLVLLAAGGVLLSSVLRGRELGSGRRAGPPPALIRPGARAGAWQGAWQAGHYAEGGQTHVVVERVYADADGLRRAADRRKVAAVDDDAPDWELRFSEAMAAARVRAEVLNAEEAG